MDRTQIMLDPELHKSSYEWHNRKSAAFLISLEKWLSKQLAERQRMALGAAARALLEDYRQILN